MWGALTNGHAASTLSGPPGPVQTATRRHGRRSRFPGSRCRTAGSSVSACAPRRDQDRADIDHGCGRASGRGQQHTGRLRDGDDLDRQSELCRPVVAGQAIQVIRRGSCQRRDRRAEEVLELAACSSRQQLSMPGQDRADECRARSWRLPVAQRFRSVRPGVRVPRGPSPARERRPASPATLLRHRRPVRSRTPCP